LSSSGPPPARRNVGIWGGANIFQQYLRAGLLGELQIHLGAARIAYDRADPTKLDQRKESNDDLDRAVHVNAPREIHLGPRRRGLAGPSFAVGDDPNAATNLRFRTTYEN
jgi:hypothetical protein